MAVVTDPAACTGRVASTAPQGGGWTARRASPACPPGSRRRRPRRGRRCATASSRWRRGPRAPPSAKAPHRGPHAPPRPRRPPRGDHASEGGGHGLRNAALVAAGLAAAGGAAVVVTQNKDDAAASPPPSGSGLPATGVSGVYVGTETVNYSGGCVGTDDVVLNLQEGEACCRAS